MLPDGSAAPCCHQHADDTTLHAASLQGVQTLLEQAVQPFCAASGALLNTFFLFFFRVTQLQARKQVDSEPRCEIVS